MRRDVRHRAAQIAKGHAVYKDKIDKKRVLLAKKPIIYNGMKANMHPSDELSDEAYSAFVVRRVVYR